MKRVFKIGEVVWFEDDHMNGWGKVGLINRSDKFPAYPCCDDAGDILTIVMDSGGEIETTPSCVYQLAPGLTFFGKAVAWEHKEDIDYPFFCPDHYENCFYFELDEDESERK